jgi:hypothetical protein
VDEKFLKQLTALAKKYELNLDLQFRGEKKVASWRALIEGKHADGDEYGSTPAIAMGRAVTEMWKHGAFDEEVANWTPYDIEEFGHLAGASMSAIHNMLILALGD